MPVRSKALTDGKIVLWHTKDPDSMVLVFERGKMPIQTTLTTREH